jgi:hypothetical protein
MFVSIINELRNHWGMKTAENTCEKYVHSKNKEEERRNKVERNWLIVFPFVSICNTDTL